MPHVTFIHGIANKPPRDKLLEAWESELELGGLGLASEGVTTSMVYWADVMYAEPLAAEASFEAVDSDLGTDRSDEELSWIDDLPEEQRRSVEMLRERLGLDMESPAGDNFEAEAPPDDPDDAEPPTFEAIPLPWFIKRRVMKAILKDVHHYLFNMSFSPRPGDGYRVQDHIRKLFVDQLKADAAANQDGAHVVVSHSMGTVISYDCLKNVPECPAVSGYMTLGSPLGISEVHDNFKPAYDKGDAFPSAKVSGLWVNVYDRLDPVALDARLANDYLKGREEVIIDQRVRNNGKWRHSSNKYYGQPKLCEHLRTLLEL